MDYCRNTTLALAGLETEKLTKLYDDYSIGHTTKLGLVDVMAWEMEIEMSQVSTAT